MAGSQRRPRPTRARPPVLRPRAARVQQLRSEVAGRHRCALLSRRDRGVAGSGGDVEHRVFRPNATGFDEPRPKWQRGTSPPSMGSPRTPTSSDGGLSAPGRGLRTRDAPSGLRRSSRSCRARTVFATPIFRVLQMTKPETGSPPLGGWAPQGCWSRRTRSTAMSCRLVFAPSGHFTWRRAIRSRPPSPK